MEGERPPQLRVVSSMLRSRFRQFKNPPQPHMCIADTLLDSSEKLYINVLGWQKIPSPKHYSDPIPLYGGMRVPQGSAAGGGREENASVFAVMVNPDILRVNGKHGANPVEREALVNLLCDFVEAMNPDVRLARQPIVLQHRDLAGELKDVWLAVQTKREQDQAVNKQCVYKVYEIDCLSEEEEGTERQIVAADNANSQPLRDARDLIKQLDSYEAALFSAFRASQQNAQPLKNSQTHAHNGHSYNFYPVFSQSVDDHSPSHLPEPPQSAPSNKNSDTHSANTTVHTCDMTNKTVPAKENEVKSDVKNTNHTDNKANNRIESDSKNNSRSCSCKSDTINIKETKKTSDTNRRDTNDSSNEADENDTDSISERFCVNKQSNDMTHPLEQLSLLDC